MVVATAKGVQSAMIRRAPARPSRPTRAFARGVGRSVASAGRFHSLACRATEASSIESEFGLPGSVSFEEGRGGLTKCTLSHVCGSSAEVYLYGACCTSWRQASGDEVLYVRPDAKFDMTKAISGGIPICFPQFGPGEMKQHGFARDSLWRVASTSADYNPDDRDPCVELVLEDKFVYYP